MPKRTVSTQCHVVTILRFMALMQDDEEGLHFGEFVNGLRTIQNLNVEHTRTILADGVVKEVADELGVPPNYVYATCNRAFARMRKNLAKLGIVKVSDILSDDKDG